MVRGQRGSSGVMDWWMSAMVVLHPEWYWSHWSLSAHTHITWGSSGCRCRGKAASVCVGGRCGQCLPVSSWVCVCVMEGVFLSSTALRIELLPSRDSFHINSGDFEGWARACRQHLRAGNSRGEGLKLPSGWCRALSKFWCFLQGYSGVTVKEPGQLINTVLPSTPYWGGSAEDRGRGMLADSIFLSNMSAEQKQKSVAEEIRSWWRLARGTCFCLCLGVPFSVTPDESLPHYSLSKQLLEKSRLMWLPRISQKISN